MWYHDHSVHITTENAYYGLQGLYIASSNTWDEKDNDCKNTAKYAAHLRKDIEERHLILADKLLDDKCQLYIDKKIAHFSFFYGDINTISGIPFPKMPLKPKLYRFRLLNGAVSRPFLVQVMLENKATNSSHKAENVYVPVQHKICNVVGTDDGNIFHTTAVPEEGILLGSGERYEIECDFREFRDSTLYLWNNRNEKLMPGVPYFCHSHLLAKIEIDSTQPIEIKTGMKNGRNIETVLEKRNIDLFTASLDEEDLIAAQNMVEKSKYHTAFKFGRNGSVWTIEDKTWDDNREAAKIEQNDSIGFYGHTKNMHSF